MKDDTCASEINNSNSNSNYTECVKKTILKRNAYKFRVCPGILYGGKGSKIISNILREKKINVNFC